MDEFMSILTKSDDIDEMNNQDIKLHLKEVVPQDVYDKWIAHFVIEDIDNEQITIGYYGKASLRKFERKYKRKVWLEICSFIGCIKKLNIYKRKNKPSVEKADKAAVQKPVEEKVPVIVVEKDVQSSAEDNVAKEQIEDAILKKTAEEKNQKSQNAVLKKAKQLIKLSIVIAIVVGLVSVTTLLGCNHISNRSFAENFYNVGNIKANEKIRIIQISDLHTSTYGKDNIQLIKRIKELKPDIIIYTGDCIEPDEASVNATLKLCSALSEVAPSYYVYGNNEIEFVYNFDLTQSVLDGKFGFNDDNRKPEKLAELEDNLKDRLENTGVKVLKNEKVEIKVGSTMVDVYGSLTSNPSAFWSYGGESFSDFIYSDETHLKIFAIHEPFVFEELEADFWGDLMLCGHTHGGLARVPLLGPLYTNEGGLFPERNDCYVSGRYSVSGKTLIVSPGLDNENPLRINNKPELTIIDINRF